MGGWLPVKQLCFFNPSSPSRTIHKTTKTANDNGMGPKESKLSSQNKKKKKRESPSKYTSPVLPSPYASSQSLAPPNLNPKVRNYRTAFWTILDTQSFFSRT